MLLLALYCQWRSSLSLRVAFRSSGMPTLLGLAVLIAILGVASHTVVAQQTNPVDRKVTNPMTDTPNVNPLTQDQPIRPRLPVQQGAGVEAGDLFKVDS